MPGSLLTPAHKELLRKATPEAVGGALTARFSRRQNRWIADLNRYRKDFCGEIKGDKNSCGINCGDATEYIAASLPAHIIDGWSFLGRAVGCALRRDTYSSVHLAYYAELRAAMAILAAAGVGIGDRRHPVLHHGPKGVPAVDLISGPATHAAIWPILNHWSGLTRCAASLDKLVRPESIQLSRWVRGIGVAASTRPRAAQWMRQWGLDLQQTESDRGLRNLASYRPSEFRRPKSLSAPEILEFVSSLWFHFEPSSDGRFLGLEKTLVREALWRADFVQADDKELGLKLENLGLGPSVAKEWIPFLKDRTPPKLVEYAQLKGSIEDPACHLSVIARAALLLYLATGMAAQSLPKTNFVKDWARRFGDERCLWDGKVHEYNPTDAWADVSASIEVARACVATGGTLYAFRTNHPYEANILAGCEVIAAWGLTR